MGVGKLRSQVIDVDDLAIGESFWSEVTGFDILPSYFPGRYGYLGRLEPLRHELILHLVKTEKSPDIVNRSHVDIWVTYVDEAIEAIEALGGTLKRAPTIYPWPGSYPGEPPQLDWAVMRDPFGNEFCVITVLTPEESRAVEEAAKNGPGDDSLWRAVAGRTRK